MGTRIGRNLPLAPQVRAGLPRRDGAASGVMQAGSLITRGRLPCVDLVEHGQTNPGRLRQDGQGTGKLEPRTHDPKLDVISNHVKGSNPIFGLENLAMISRIIREWPQRERFRQLVDDYLEAR